MQDDLIDARPGTVAISLDGVFKFGPVTLLFEKNTQTHHADQYGHCWKPGKMEVCFDGQEH